MVRGETESAQIPICVAANGVGVALVLMALVLTIVGDNAPFLEESTISHLWFDGNEAK